MGMAEGVLAINGIPNLSEEDEDGEKSSRHTPAAQTEVKQSSLMIQGAAFKHQMLGLLLEWVIMLQVKGLSDHMLKV